MAWACSWYSMLLGSYSQPPMGQDICFITSKASQRVPTLPQCNSPLACFAGETSQAPREAAARLLVHPVDSADRDSEGTALYGYLHVFSRVLFLDTGSVLVTGD